MIKKILILGVDTEKGKKTFDFFIKYSNKYKIEGISFTKEEASEEILKDIKKYNIKEILVKTETFKKKLEEVIEINTNIYTNSSYFVKNSLSDIVFFAIEDIDCVTQILSAISEYKDVCFIDWNPLLYIGKIIFNEIKNKGIRFYPISTTIYSVEQIISENKENFLDKIGLIKTNTKEKDYLKTPKQQSYKEFKEIFYNDYFINAIYDMFLLSNIYEISSKKFYFYEQNKDVVNVIVSFLDGSNIINYSLKDITCAFNHYFLSRNDLKKLNVNENNKKIDDFSISRVESSKYKILELAIECLIKNVFAPVLFYISIEYLTRKLYEKKITLKKIEQILEEIVFNKSYYGTSLDLKTIIALKTKIEKYIDKKL